MNKMHLAVSAAVVIGCLSLWTERAGAHGLVGDRFFPSTVTTEDPFAVDELSISVSHFKSRGEEGEPGTVESAGGFEFTKEIFPRFAIGIEENYVHLKTRGEKSVSGFDNLGLSLKYQVWESAAHEAIVSIGLETDLGGTGSHDIGESFTTFTPTFFFGKGFGDLPDSMGGLKPLAITGSIGQTLPTSAEEPNVLEWSFAIEYSLPYLQQHVKDVGLPEPFKSMIPVIEFNFETPENRGENVTTGTINPGVLWELGQFQLGVEALIPINHDSGDRIGVAVNLQIYIDDIFPSAFGHPVFGAR